MADFDPKSVRRILVIQVSRIGDTLLATPTIRAIAAAYPDARLTCLAHPKRKEVLEGLPFISRLGAITKKWAPFLGWLGGKRYDLAFVFGFDQPLVSYAMRVARHVVAFEQGVGALDQRLWKRCAEPPFQSIHAVEVLLRLSDAMHIPRAGLGISYRVSDAEKQWANRELAPVRANHAHPLIGLQVASFPTKGYRDWPIQNFIELCRRLRGAYPSAHFLILGGALEKERTQALHASLPDCSSHYAGRLSLRQTGALMNELDVYVGVDTGPTHIMGALHRPMVSIYHGYSPSRLLAPLEHPCLHVVDHPRADQGKTPDDYSMNEITVEQVYAHTLQALTEKKPDQ